MKTMLLVIGLVVAAAATMLPQQRFDYLLSADIVAGFAGNTERLLRGLETAERLLAESPGDSETPVWQQPCSEPTLSSDPATSK